MISIKKKLDIVQTEGNIIIGYNDKVKLPVELNNVVDEIKKKENELGKFNKITSQYLDDNFKARKLIIIGLGDESKYKLENLQKLFSTIANNIEDKNTIIVDTFKPLKDNIQYVTELLVETIGLKKYEMPTYKNTKKENKDFSLEIYSNSEIEESVIKGIINYEGTNNARTLVNEPRNKMTPSILAEYSKQLAKKYGMEIKVYNKKEIEELGMGAFLAVNQGSKEEAKLIHIKYRGDKSSDEITALVGKGVTYDSGGYSIKPKDGMAGMKGDMGGSASVLGAIEVIARKQLKANVDVVIAATENLISNEAVVPDDVCVAMNGKTIEILNTDAEGRLTLVDAVYFAIKEGATKVIDVATLTGGVVVAIGTELTGGFTNNQEFFLQVVIASEKTGEPIWQLPITDHFKERVRKSDVADYNNSPGRDGHASFGATIIGEFAEDVPWVHLDIAGTSDKKAPHILGPKGATGVMVRTLAKIFE